MVKDGLFSKSWVSGQGPPLDENKTGLSSHSELNLLHYMKLKIAVNGTYPIIMEWEHFSRQYMKPSF